MLKIIRKEEEDHYENVMTAISLVTYRESMTGLKSLPHIEDINDLAAAMRAAVGQVVLDKVIEETKDLDRDALVRWFAESSATMLVGVMNDNPAYRMSIQLLSEAYDKGLFD